MKTKKQIRRWAALPLLIMLAALVMIGCSKKNAAAANGKTLKKFEAPFTATGTGNALLAIAYDLKYFEDAGLDVILKPLNTGVSVDQLVAVSTGKTDVAHTGGTATPLLFIEQGNDLVIIGGTMGEGASLITRPEVTAQYADFNKETLYGKKVGVVRANTGDVALRGWLARQGADLSKITFVELDSAPTIIEAVRKGEIDVGNVFTFWRQTAHNQGLPAVFHVDEVSPNFPCCRISTMRDKLNERREDYVAFLKGLIRAYKYFNEEQEKSLDILRKYYDADREVLKNVYYDYGHYTISPDPERERVLEYYRGMTAVGYAKGEGDIPSHVDSSLYRDALNQVLAENPGDAFFGEMKRHFDENN